MQDPLLDQLVGKWILQGTIDDTDTTHDIDCEWVLGHHYMRIHEVSHEKNADEQPAYEAIVFIGWDDSLGEYACLWLDSTSGAGLSAHAIIARAKPASNNELAFLFKGQSGSVFHTTFAYNKDTDGWQWIMDGEEDGKLLPFARVTLTRK